MMFENCIIKYLKDEQNKNFAVKIIYPKNADGVVREICCPMHQANTDYQNVLQWVADGNTIQEAD
jgi:hypothetical protein